MSKPSLLRRLLSAIWNTITRIRLALANILFLVMIALVYFVYIGGAQEPLPERAALLLNLSGTVVDQKSDVDPFRALLGEPSPTDHEVLLRDVIESIEYAAEDPSISGHSAHTRRFTIGANAPRPGRSKPGRDEVTADKYSTRPPGAAGPSVINRVVVSSHSGPGPRRVVMGPGNACLGGRDVTRRRQRRGRAHAGRPSIPPFAIHASMASGLPWQAAGA